MENRKIHILGGGTISHVRPHLALTAAAYGSTAKKLEELCQDRFNDMDVQLHLTKMANSGKGNLETNDDISNLLDELVEDYSTKMVIMNAAIVDYSGNVIEKGYETPSGKDQKRLKTSNGERVCF